MLYIMEQNVDGEVKYHHDDIQQETSLRDK